MVKPLSIPEPASRWGKIRLSLALLLITVVGIYGIRFVLLNIGQDRQQAIRVVKADTGPVEVRVKGYGNLVAQGNTSVIAQVEGVITSIDVLPGTSVKQGDKLLQLESPRLQRELANATLEWYQAQADYESDMVEINQKTLEVTNDLEMAQVDLSIAEKELSILAALQKKQFGSELDYQRALASTEKAKLTLAQKKQAKQLWQTSLTAKRTSAKYALKASEERLNIAKQDIQRLSIFATNSGVFNRLEDGVELGKIMREGDALGVILDPSRLQAEVYISAADMEQVSVGMLAEVSLMSQSFKARVQRIYPKVEDNLVRVALLFTEPLPASAKDNLDLAATIFVATVPHATRLALPVRYSHQTEQSLFHVLDGNEFVLKPLDIGLVGQDYMEIIGGVSPGQSVLAYYPDAWMDSPRISTEDLGIERIN